MALSLASLAVISCSPDLNDSDRDINVIGDVADSTDALERRLVAHQRKLLRGLALGDSTAVGALIATDFIAYDPRTPGTGISQITYFQTLAGALQDKVASEYSTYHVSTDGNHAVVWSIGEDAAVRISWRQGEAEWVATRLLQVSASDARRNIDAQRGR